MMRFVWSTAVKELRRRRRDPFSLAAWVSIPLFIIVLMQLAFGGGQAKPHGLLLVADEDGSLAGRLVTSAFTQGRLGEMISVEKVDQAAGRARMQKGGASALLVIPKGFGAAFLRREPARLQLTVNPAQRLLPNILEETLSLLVEGGHYLQLVAGDQLRVIAQGPPGGGRDFPDLGVAAISVKFNQLVNRLRTYLDPPRIKLETTVLDAGPRVNFAEAFLPGMLVLALMFVSQGLGADLWKEHQMGTLRRAAAMPQSLGAFLAGKALAAAVVMAGVGAAGLALAWWLVGLRLSRLPAALVWITASGAAFFLLLSLVQMAASNPRTGNLLASVVIFPLAMLGGSFFPFEFMPAGLARIGRLTPNGRMTAELHSILSGPADPLRWTVALAAVGVLAGLAFALLSRRLRRLV